MPDCGHAEVLREDLSAPPAAAWDAVDLIKSRHASTIAEVCLRFLVDRVLR